MKRIEGSGWGEGGRVDRSKYRAIPITVDGYRFHSKREAARYGELKLLQKAGEIDGEIELQPPFPLYLEDPYTDESVYVCTYIADFMYTRADGEVKVEDVKGFDTPMGKLK